MKILIEQELNLGQTHFALLSFSFFAARCEPAAVERYCLCYANPKKKSDSKTTSESTKKREKFASFFCKERKKKNWLNDHITAQRPNNVELSPSSNILKDRVEWCLKKLSKIQCAISDRRVGEWRKERENFEFTVQTKSRFFSSIYPRAIQLNIVRIGNIIFHAGDDDGFSLIGVNIVGFILFFFSIKYSELSCSVLEKNENQFWICYDQDALNGASEYVARVGARKSFLISMIFQV